jgi:hypothetical protein
MRLRPIQSLSGLSVCLGTALAFAGSALATDPGATRASDDARLLAPTNPWTLSVTPYGWLPFFNGDVTIKGRTVSVDVTPIELLEHLDAAPWMSYVEARKGPFAIYNDIVYAKVGVDANHARSIDGLNLNATANLKAELAIIEAGAAYEIARWQPGGSIKDNGPQRFTAFDLIVGARYWHQEMAISLALSAFDTTGLDVSGSRAVARGGSVDWVDPLVGFRIRHQLSPGHELVFRADVGGFDVGSQFSWNLMGAYSWDFAVRDGVTLSGLLGYRALSVDYAKGSGLSTYEYDVVMHGPIVGLMAKF